MSVLIFIHNDKEKEVENFWHQTKVLRIQRMAIATGLYNIYKNNMIKITKEYVSSRNRFL